MLANKTINVIPPRTPYPHTPLDKCIEALRDFRVGGMPDHSGGLFRGQELFDGLVVLIVIVLTLMGYKHILKTISENSEGTLASGCVVHTMSHGMRGRGGAVDYGRQGRERTGCKVAAAHGKGQGGVCQGDRVPQLGVEECQGAAAQTRHCCHPVLPGFS